MVALLIVTSSLALAAIVVGVLIYFGFLEVPSDARRRTRVEAEAAWAEAQMDQLSRVALDRMRDTVRTSGRPSVDDQR